MQNEYQKLKRSQQQLSNGQQQPIYQQRSHQIETEADVSSLSSLATQLTNKKSVSHLDLVARQQPALSNLNYSKVTSFALVEVDPDALVFPYLSTAAHHECKSFVMCFYMYLKKIDTKKTKQPALSF